MTEFVFEIRLRAGMWRLAAQGDSAFVCFETYEAAERRGRFLAIRQDVRGLATVIHVLDEAGVLIGLWRGERYRPASQTLVLRHAA